MDTLRTFLFVPADSSRKLASARNVHPDALIYDLEDAVAPDKKNEARLLLSKELKTFAHSSAKLFVRVNVFGSPFLEADLQTAVCSSVYGIVLPKCNDPAEVAQVHQSISRLESHAGMADGGVKVVLMVESAKGVAQVCELARSSSRALALLFGGEDYCADMGIQRTKSGGEIEVARSLVAIAAKAERLEPIDGPFIDFNDAAGLFEETRHVKQMGFSGKALIHPNQIDTVHRALSPSPEEISFAEEVVAAFDKSDQGVVVVRSKMIDGPVVSQARRILKQHARNRPRG
jgi:citrate lyase subunit beta/citryl-CoA lyase